MQLLLYTVIALIVFWLAPIKWRMLVLSILSFVIVLHWDSFSALLLTISSVIVFYGSANKKLNTLIMVALVLQLIVIKSIFSLVPLGLSFFSFCLLHYCIEQRKGHFRAHSASEFFSYIFLFPIYSAGPIERFEHFLEHQEDRPIWMEGGQKIAVGVIKKWVIADWLLPLWIAPWNSDVLASYDANIAFSTLWILLIVFFLQLYFDFSGYCDLAIGTCLLFGIRIADNFNWPLLSKNLSDFWKRWHISLSNWCQRYVYMPVLGITRNPYAAITATFVVMGLWHAQSLHWLCWGLWHAAGLIVHLRWRRLSRNWGWTNSLWWRINATLITFLYVCCAGVFTQLYGKGDLSISLQLLSKALGIGYLF